MSARSMPDFVIAATAEIATVASDAMAEAVDVSERQCGGLSHSKYPWLRPAHIRAVAREALEVVVLPQGWRVSGRSRQSGQLLLVRDDITVRILKERSRTYPGGVPVAGSNAARRAFFRDRTLVQPTLFTEDHGMQDPVRTLLLWDYLDTEERRLGLSLRMVHTVEEGIYGSAVPLDLSIPVTPDPGYYAGLDFATDNTTEDLFKQADIDREENERAE